MGGITLLTVPAVTNGANTATFTGNGSFAQTGVWGSGGGGITLGPGFSGVATLNQANTYSGLTTINSGILRDHGNASALGSNAAACRSAAARCNWPTPQERT